MLVSQYHLFDTIQFEFTITDSGVDRTKPFGNEVFPVLLSKLFFRKSSDVGVAFKNRFFSSVEDDKEPEMSAPMLSFAGFLVSTRFTDMRSSHMSSSDRAHHWGMHKRQAHCEILLG